ncbi:hypothetical protein Vafri_16989 [Volvox africanus]|uniref:Uncharacterized protein n=1 Tax=Volvox africanus TaxID=51714 RepID=A0A8J4F711_9CHLO|nr:hypothetical protein Vafri_16989 [Volvox africanus]
MKTNHMCCRSRSTMAESGGIANVARKPRVWRSTPNKPIDRCPSYSQLRAASSKTSLPKAFESEQRASEEAISWDYIYVGRMPLVGFEAVSAIILLTNLLPASLSQWLPLHSFVALGSSRNPEEGSCEYANCVAGFGVHLYKQGSR